MPHSQAVSASQWPAWPSEPTGRGVRPVAAGDAADASGDDRVDCGAFEFADGKPIELLSGANLLYLLAEHADIEASIMVPENSRHPSQTPWIRPGCGSGAGTLHRAAGNEGVRWQHGKT